MIPIPAWSLVCEGLLKNWKPIAFVLAVIVLSLAWKEYKSGIFEDGKTEAKQEQKEIDHAADERRKAVPPATSDDVSRSLRAGTF